MPSSQITAFSAVDDGAHVSSLEGDWDRVTAGATPWRPPWCRIVVVAPHPDDETLGCGGLIAYQRRRGLPVLVVAASDGEAAYPHRSRDEIAAIRRLEQTRALAALRVRSANIQRCRLPDGQLAAHVEELARRVAALVHPGDLVIAPWVHDHHCDHVACARAAARAAERAGASRLGSLFWAYHRTRPEVDVATHFVRLQLDEDLIGRRAAALAKHVSQLPGGEKRNGVLTPALLQPLARNVELYATTR